jgi:predicted PurR-regulated permease PerM
MHRSGRDGVGLDMPDDTRRAANGVHPTFDRLAAYAWRTIVIAVVVIASLWLLRQLRVVFFPVVVALFLARALSPVSGRLRRHGWPPSLAAGASMLAMFAVVGGVLALVVPVFARELGAIGPTLTEAADDVERWLVEHGPFDLTRADVAAFRERAGEEVTRLTRSTSNGSVTDRAALVAEVLTGAVLTVLLTFFMLRDGRRFAAWTSTAAHGERGPKLRRAMNAAWETLAGYLRGATLLGAIEAAIIGAAMFLTGSSLVAPVMLITFLGAYVPLIGAVVTGLVAVLVTLATGGIGAAAIVAVVALLVQQFDNDLLAPIVYGRALNLHPVAVLVSVIAGGALFGIAGTLLAVPVVAVATNSTREFRTPPTPIAGSDGKPGSSAH